MEESLLLFTYDNYRDFLKDYFKKKREIQKIFSLRCFSQVAGFADHSLLTHLVSGRRNATKNTLNKLINGIGLQGNAKEYFVNLVKYTQEKNPQEKEQWLEKLNELRKKREIDTIEQEHNKGFDKWYYSVIRDLAITDLWEGDFKKLGSLLKPHVVAHKVKEAVEELVEMGMLECREGKYYKPETIIMPSSVTQKMIHRNRRDLLSVGALASETCSVSERYFLNYGVMVTEGNVPKYFELIKEFEKEVRALRLIEHGEPDRMYQLNLQFFPTSKSLQNKKGE